MSKQRRSNIAAGGILGLFNALAMSHGVAVAQSEGRVKPKHIVNSASNQDHAAARPLAVDRKPYEPRCEHPQGRDEADLCAQRRMADAAEETVALTFAQIIVGALGIAGLIGTILLSIKATNAAIRPAKAAEEAVGTERAWMTFEGISTSEIVNGHIDGLPVAKGLRLQATWKNTGRSPALNADIYRDIRLCNFDEPIPLFDIRPPPEDVRTMPIGPGKQVSSSAAGLNDEQYLAFRERRQRVFFYSHVRYHDTFDRSKVRMSLVCVELTYHGEVVGPGVIVIPHIEQTPRGPQNTAD